MARRSHTETFILLRNNATKSRNFYKDFDNDDERAKLMNGKSLDANEIELGDGCAADGTGGDAREPDWVASIEQFRYECNKIHAKIDQLNAIQNEQLKRKVSSIFLDDSETAANESYEIEIEFKCQEVNKLFNRLHSLLTQMQSLASLKPNSRVIQNVFQWQVREVSDLTQKFRSSERNYVNKCNDGDQLDQFVITFEDERPADKSVKFFDSNGGSNESAATSVQFYGDSKVQTQKQLSSFSTETLRARDQEMSSIVKSIVELNQIFHDVNTFVINQGSLLDRIDYNIESVQQRVEDGVIELSKAERSMKSARKMKFILILSGIVMLLLLYLVVFSN